MVPTEQQFENQLIEKLQGLKYVYRPDIRDRKSLETNFREKFQALNQVNLIDSEFNRLLDEIITPDVYESSKKLRETNTFIREDGTPLHYTLVNTRDWCKNDFEVVNQLRINTDNSNHRYDVILLLNGVPLVQIELKTLGLSPKRAIEQIVHYKNDPGNGYTRTLLSFIQLFVVSNRTDTWYFANNNARHFAFNAEERFLPVYQFALEDNQKVNHIDDFADKFLAKCTLSEMISRYMVLVASEQKLMMMRPYQIYAVKAIVERIHQGAGNGYIWHTTGSGKTLTSFKASTLLKDNHDIHKCVFVVDRKDLDRQTREEFNRFQEGCVEQNTNTGSLVQRLLSEDYADKVIVTTIQKLGLALDDTNQRNYKEQLKPLRDKRMVFIFDECHRSQFGENHKAIKDFFPNAQLFGFTGTPIFPENSTAKQFTGDQGQFRTTADLFQTELHAYTITHAIDDRNVLRFHVDFYKPDGKKIKPGETLTKRAVVEAIISKHKAATGERKFNAILATSSINDAIEYFNVFKQAQAERIDAFPDHEPLKVAAVFSPPPKALRDDPNNSNSNGAADVEQLQEDLAQEFEDNKVDPEAKKNALIEIIADYNKLYGTNHTIYNFDLYYQDIQKRIKDQQYPNSDLPQEQKIDITIVVDMLLTGFDSKFLNTLYVDKNLKHHGLIQAFSRTNRILNATKPYGNILDFRGQEGAVDEAVAMFSGAKIDNPREIWLVEKAPKVIEKLDAAVKKLERFMKSQGVEFAPESVSNLKGTDARVGFIQAFKEVQRLQTQLDQYTDLSEADKSTVQEIISTEQLRGFRGAYIDTAERIRTELGTTGGKKPDSSADQLDFEFVLFSSALIDYDYIMALIARYSQQPPGKQKVSRDQLIGLIQSDSKFIDERELISEYVQSLKVGEGLNETQIREGYLKFKAEKEHQDVAQLAKQQGLSTESLDAFVETILSRKIFDGEQLTELLAPLDLGWRARTQKELELMAVLVPLLKKRAGGQEISGLSAYEQ